MQTSNPSPQHSSIPTPQSFDEALADAYVRAIHRRRTSEPGLGELFAALIGRGAAPSGDRTGASGTTAPHAPGAPPDEGAPDEGAPDDDAPEEGGARVTLDELIPVFRAPIEWALARADRHADGDPLDLAALARVRAAYEGRLAWAMSGGVFGVARPHVRPTDLITVAGLVIGSLNPGFGARASSGLRESFFEALADVIPIALASTPEIPSAPQSAGPLGYGAAFPSAPLRFGALHTPCPAMPACCCRCGHVL